MPNTLIRGCALGIFTALTLGVTVLPLHAQEIQTQTLGRAYWHVFAAYAVAWALVLGWIVSVARRLARVRERLDR